jgi:hypothetical protein
MARFIAGHFNRTGARQLISSPAPEFFDTLQP